MSLNMPLNYEGGLKAPIAIESLWAQLLFRTIQHLQQLTLFHSTHQTGRWANRYGGLQDLEDKQNNSNSKKVWF